MPTELNFSIAPFNILTASQQQKLARHVDIAYFRSNDIILHQGQSTESLYIIIKGLVEERSDDSGEIYAHYTHDDIFDVRSQLDHSVKHNYHALEDTLCHLIPTDVFLSMYHENPNFSAYFNGSLAKRKALLAQANQQQNLAEFILTKIDDDTIQKSVTVDWNTSLKKSISEKLKDNELALSAFTRPALQFTVPLTLFGNVKNKKECIDIKQGGIFPIVHGIRALSLEQGIKKTNTFQRIEELSLRKVLEPSTADNLTEALKLFFKWRLRHQLQENQNRVSNHIHIEQLDRTERDLLRHSLHVVKKFKEWLGYHYQIRD